jgi:hypothetical protein
LVALCREYHLPTSGSKPDLLEYICNFIENKPVVIKSTRKNSKSNSFMPSLDAVIDSDYTNNEVHRAFFKSIIGGTFKYNVPFINWMNENKGKKTYHEAIEIYNKILVEKKSGIKFEIGKQFEYNRYTRDFFQDNHDLTISDCIKCWNYKKNAKGAHTYERTDLKVLKL